MCLLMATIRFQEQTSSIIKEALPSNLRHSRHSFYSKRYTFTYGLFAISSPSVVIGPCPGRTVFVYGNENNRFWMESIMAWWLQVSRRSSHHHYHYHHYYHHHFNTGIQYRHSIQTFSTDIQYRHSINLLSALQIGTSNGLFEQSISRKNKTAEGVANTTRSMSRSKNHMSLQGEQIN